MKGIYVAEALFYISVFVFLVTLVIIWPYLFGAGVMEKKHLTAKRRKNRKTIQFRHVLRKIKDYFKQARGKTHLIWVS